LQRVGLTGKSVFIIPAFFELLLHLKATHRSFSLVFRTFGKELNEVVTEFNAFCEGRHPLYPQVPNTLFAWFTSLCVLS
jgi:hypothetical protein